jgi:hypothetical protein
VALISRVLICCYNSFISACVYVSWRRNSSCCVVFIFNMYAVGAIVLFFLLTMTFLRHLQVGCFNKVDTSGLYVVLLLLSVMQQGVGIFVI